MTLTKRLALFAVAAAGLALSGCATSSLQQRYNPTPFTTEGTVIATMQEEGYYSRTPRVIDGYLLMRETYHPGKWSVHARTPQGTIVTCPITAQVFDQLRQGSPIVLTLKQKSAAHDFECLEATLPL